VLINALNYEDSSSGAKVIRIRVSAANALGKIGSDAGIPELVNTLNHEKYAVRGEAIDALGNNGSDAAIGELVNALYHETYYVRWRAAEVLGKIASPELLPDLSERLKTDEETNLLNAIGVIQERCKFYNYTLTQPSSPPV
jgi:HEAT repeat protein